MDSRIFDLISQETERQKKTLMMIPSENYTYDEVRWAVGSVLMHKYAEGYPNRRYYQGNKIIDQVEDLARNRALDSFGLDPKVWSVNVQPHSGSEANLAVYNALLQVGDRIMSMFLPDGGHLSHGWQVGEKKVTLVSKIYTVAFYKLNPEKRLLDYEAIEKQAEEFKPKLMISGGTAYPREIDYQRLALIAHKVGAYFMADVAHEAGLISAGAVKSPFGFADVVTMTTHKTLRGPRGAIIFSKKELGEAIDSSIIPGIQGGPHLHSIAGIAVALEKTKTDEFKKYAMQTVVNARALAKVLLDGGLDVVSGGTDKHLVLVDLRNKQTSGWFVAWALEAAGIIVNRNAVPNETASPFYPSGIRMGTQALTVRGMKETEMKLIGGWILKVVEHVGTVTLPEDKAQRNSYLSDFLKKIEGDEQLIKIRKEVEELCSRFPVPEL